MKVACLGALSLLLVACSDTPTASYPPVPMGTVLPGPAGDYQRLLARSLDACGVPDRCGPDGLSTYVDGLGQVTWPPTVSLDVAAASAAASAVLHAFTSTTTEVEAVRTQLVSTDIRLRHDFGLPIPTGFPTS